MGSRVFGGATTDDLSWTSNISALTSGAFLVGGWFKPTTLTSGRYLFSVGNTSGLSINTTTSELQWLYDATTDGVYTSSGAGITANEWVFIATYCGLATSNSATMKLWVGRLNGGLNEISVTQTTAPSGSFVGTTGRTVGNRGTGSVSFQGNVGWLYIVQPPVLSAGPLVALPMVTAQTPTADELELVKHWYVEPMFRGKVSAEDLFMTNTSCVWSVVDLTQPTPYVTEMVLNNSLLRPALSVNGITYSEESPPVPCPRMISGQRNLVLA